MSLRILEILDHIKHSNELSIDDLFDIKDAITDRLSEMIGSSSSKRDRRVIKTVIGYQYIQQKSQRGNTRYWYISRARKYGVKRSYYLGKNKPSFNPLIDLVLVRDKKRKRNQKSRQFT